MIEGPLGESKHELEKSLEKKEKGNESKKKNYPY